MSVTAFKVGAIGLNLPKGNAQTPDGFHLVTRSPACSNPIAVDDMPAIVFE